MSINNLVSKKLSEVLAKVEKLSGKNRTAPYSKLSASEKQIIQSGFQELKGLLQIAEEKLNIADLKVKPGTGRYQASGRAFPHIWGAFIPKEVERVSHITPQLYVFSNSNYIGAGVCPSDAAYANPQFVKIMQNTFAQEATLVENLLNKGFELAPAGEVTREEPSPGTWLLQGKSYHIRRKINPQELENPGEAEKIIWNALQDLLPLYRTVVAEFRKANFFAGPANSEQTPSLVALKSNWQEMWAKHYEGPPPSTYKIPEYLQPELGQKWESYRQVWRIGRREALKAIELVMKDQDPGQERVEALIKGNINRTNYSGGWRMAVVRNFSEIIKIIHRFHKDHPEGCTEEELSSLLSKVKPLSAKNRVRSFVTRFLCDFNPNAYLPHGSWTGDVLLAAAELFEERELVKNGVERYEDRCALAQKLAKHLPGISKDERIYEFDHFLYWLSNRVVPKERKGQKQRYWRVSCGERGNLAQTFYDKALIAIAFRGEPDLNKFTSRNKLRKHLIATKAHKSAKYVSDQLWHFKKDISEGDYIFGYGASAVKMIGTVQGPYQNKTVEEWAGPESNEIEDGFKHIRSVDWLTDNPVATNSLSPELAKKLGDNCTIVEITKSEADEILSASNLKQASEQTASTPSTSAKPAESSISLEELCSITSKSKDEIATVERLLKSKKQIVFYGPPGTGKTFLTKHFINWFQRENGLREFVQFHPSYAYEDFMEGLRPRSQNGQMEFRVESGVFKRFCDEARKYPDKNAKHVFVIDEINRGNIPQIFGELLSALEYREQSIRLPYSKEQFEIPENVYIIGTMNSADRSIAVVDYALRRRFKFIELKPDHIALKNYLQKNGCDVNLEHLIAAFQKLNNEIQKDRSKEYAIGHSYLMETALCEESLSDISHFGIKPLLEEYFFDEPQKVDRLDLLKLLEEQKKTSSGHE